MRRTVLTFGLLSGGLLSVLMAAHMALHDRIGFEGGLVVGYATMVLSFLFIYFGVRSYRDTVAGGSVGFGRALAVGLLIGLVASLCYVLTWEVMYFGGFVPDFMEKYAAHELEKARADGATPQQLATKAREMADFARMYRNPLVNAAYTFLEPLPVALVMSLVSAGLLRRREAPEPREAAVGTTQPAL